MNYSYNRQCQEIGHTTDKVKGDDFKKYISTAVAVGSIARCGLAAAGIAVMKPLMNRVGNGWYFTMSSAVGFVEVQWELSCCTCMVWNGGYGDLNKA